MYNKKKDIRILRFTKTGIQNPRIRRTSSFWEFVGFKALVFKKQQHLRKIV